MIRKTMEKLREYHIKQWEKNGKIEKNAWKMMPSKTKVKGWKLMGWKHNGKIEAPMWDHYRVKHA